MRLEATLFICDTSKCHHQFVTTATIEGAIYLDLVEAGWVVKHPIVGKWKHYCPDHQLNLIEVRP